MAASPFRRTPFLAVLVMGAWTMASATADPLVWDASGDMPNNPQDSSGTWTTSPTNTTWSTIDSAPAGQGQDVAWNNSAGDVAVFGDDLALIQISAGNVTADGVTFNDTVGNPAFSDTISGMSSATNTLTLAGPGPVITANSDGEIDAVIAGSAGFTKAGTGSLLLAGDAGPNTYTGTVNVSAGTLELNGSATNVLITGNLDVASGAAVIDSQGGAIATTSSLLLNGTLQASNETLAGLTGNGTVNLSQGPLSGLVLAPAQSQTFAGSFTGNSNVTLNLAPNAVETWTGSSNTIQQLQINSGVLAINSTSALGGTNALNGGTIRYTGSGGTLGGLSLGANGGTLDSSGTGPLHVNSVQAGSGDSLTLTGTSNAANTLNAFTGSLTKDGMGTWSYQGGAPLASLSVNEGLLEATSLFVNGTTTLSGTGTLELTDGSLHGQTLEAAGGTLMLTTTHLASFGSLSRAAGGGLTIVPQSSTTLGSTQEVGFNTPPAMTNGIVDASIVAANSATDTSADFLSYNSVTGLGRATYSSATSLANGGPNGTTATSVFHATTATNNFFGSTQLYALKVDSNAVVLGGVLTLGDGTHTAGLILDGGNAATPTTINAAVNFAPGSEGAVYVGGNGTSTYAQIIGGVSGTNGLTKNGNGTLELVSPESYTGPTTINNGTLVFDNAGSKTLGSSASVINLASTLLFKGTSGPVFATINLIADGTLGSGSASAVYAGTLNGNGYALNIASSSSSGTVQMEGTESDINASQYNVNVGTLGIGGSLGTTHAAIVVNEGQTGQGVLSLRQGALVSNSIVLNGGRLTGADGSTVTGPLSVQSPFGFVGATNGNMTLSGGIHGTGALYFQSTGQVTVSGANTYTGPTEVIGGKLVVTGDITSSSSVNVSAAPGSTSQLSGTGNVSAINLGANGQLAPGLNGTIGTLHATSLDWTSDGSAQMKFELNTSSNASSLLDLGTGTFLKDANSTSPTFSFDLLGTGEAGQSYDLVNFGAGDTNFNATDFASTDLAPGLSGSFSLVTNGDVESLVLAVAPEPSSTELLFMGVLVLAVASPLRRFRLETAAAP